jgi:DNA-binding XRE family transcriptional regulator
MLITATNNRLRELRQACGLAQVGLAVLARVSPNTILSIERWGHVPSEPVQQRIAQALQLTIVDIWPALEKGPAA